MSRQNRIVVILFLSILSLSSCQSQTTTEQDTDSIKPPPAVAGKEPDYNYVLEVPDGWTIRDTTMPGGLKIRFLLSPISLSADYPAGNVVIALMEGRTIDEFTTRNMDYLKSNMEGITIIERGNIDSTTYNGQWFTYTKDQNGVVRDMINYIIPLNGFAYMITFGANQGSMHKHRTTFDKIARSFKG
ncbi:MAG: hypothetical protein DI538_11960 [Azospira oryzae]|nr:MAG: hypothetical protein DI538_11960 [Azospira oryzae]